jgi:hypothetical protein
VDAPASTYVLIDNTIVANNTAPSGGAAIWKQSGTVIATNSLLRGTVQGATTTGCILNQDPKLLPLADNGGATPTCALESDSPCRGTASSLTALTTDQRGYARDAAPDMGAFEYGAHARLPQGTLLSIR